MLLILLSSLICHSTRSARVRSDADNAATGIIFAALLGSRSVTLVMPFVSLCLALFDGLLFCSLGLLVASDAISSSERFNLAAAVIAPLGYVELIGRSCGYLLLPNFPDLWAWLGSGDHRIRHLRVASRSDAR